MKAQKRQGSAGFAISTYHQDVIAENAKERFGEQADPYMVGLVDPRGHILSAGWEELKRDIATIERNAMAWLRKTFNDARDEGHSGDELVGTLWFNPRSKKQLSLLEIGQNERIDMTDASYGDFARVAFKGVSRLGEQVLGGAIHFYDVQEAE